MEVGERRTEIVMEREIIQKLSCRWGCGVFLPVMDESHSFKGEESSNSCLPHISAGLTSSRMPGC